MPRARYQELTVSQHRQESTRDLHGYIGLLGLQELLTFTEQSNASSRAAGAELGHSSQHFPPWEVPTAAHRSRHWQVPGLSVKSHSQGISNHKGKIKAQWGWLCTVYSPEFLFCGFFLSGGFWALNFSFLLSQQHTPTFLLQRQGWIQKHQDKRHLSSRWLTSPTCTAGLSEPQQRGGNTSLQVAA